MSQLGDLDVEASRFVESASDALSDDIVARLAEVAGDGLVLLDQATQSNLDKALPVISRMIENGDFERVVNMTRVMGSAADALSDDIVGRLAETAGELMCVADRLARNENLMKLLNLLENDELVDSIVEFAEVASEVKKTGISESSGGITGIYKTMTDPDVQNALGLVGAVAKAYKHK